MRLKKITISNFGIYQNENTFSFPYSKDKKVSLIIGKNGSGKTTFLNAMKICLFGSMILKNRTITKNYENFILEKLNKNALKEKLPKFGIKATFISNVHNYDGDFTIERNWNLSDKFNETVSMHRNNIELTEDQQMSFFNAFYHAFPLDLFDLFYLDGEKIDQLSVLNSNIFNLLESSINIDLFKRLQSDLLTYAAKRVNNKAINILTLQKEEMHNSKRNLLKELENHQKNHLAYQESINQNSDEIKNLKDSLKITKITTDDALLRSIQQEIVLLKRSIETDISKHLPYTLINKQLKKLLLNISNESKQGENQVIQKALSSTELLGYLEANNAIPNHENVIKQISEFFQTSDNDFTHKLGIDDFYSLKQRIESIQKFNKSDLENRLKELSKLEKKYKKLTSNALELEVIKSAGELENLLSIQESLDKNTNNLCSTDQSITKINNQLLVIDSDIKSLDNNLWKELKKSNISNILNQVNIVLDKYLTEIKERKISDIETHTKEMFTKLIRKEGFINDFKIDNDSIYLYDKNNNRLNHTNLSAGEKQLFVLSLLYAVLQSSERKVPLMFDTLLGRLDKEHRDNVFKEFITACPDQVIILATDSELSNIDNDFLSQITNTRYSIDFSKTENQMSEMRL